MNSEYFKTQILEELDGACDYITKAIEIKPMQADWSKKLYDMSIQETNHAMHLYGMFHDYIEIQKKAYPVLPDYIQKNWDCVVSCYADKIAKIKQLQNYLKE